MKKQIKIYIPFLIFILLIFVILINTYLIEGTDDTVHLTYLNGEGIFKWINYRIVSWQPRIFSDFFFALLINKLWLWKILTSVLQGLTLFVIYKVVIINLGHNSQLKVILCGMFFYIYPYVISSCLMWYTGSFYYVWITCMLIITLVPFYYIFLGKQIVYSKIYYVLYFTAICCCYTEQTLAVAFCFGLCSLIFGKIRKIEIPKRVVIIFGLIIINGAGYIALSQLGNRSISELHWYPSYDSLSFIDKIFQGINWTNYYYINSSNLLMLILSASVFFLISIKKDKKLNILAVIPFLYFLCNIIPFDSLFNKININNSNVVYYTAENSPYMFEHYLNNVLYNTNKINPNEPLSNYIDFLPSFAGMFMMLYIVVLLWIAFDDIGDKFAVTLLYLAMLATGYIISFSPTIFASGSRVFYLGTILLLFVIARVISKILENGITITKRIVYMGLFISGILYFQLLFKTTNGVLWL